MSVFGGVRKFKKNRQTNLNTKTSSMQPAAEKCYGWPGASTAESAAFANRVVAFAGDADAEEEDGGGVRSPCPAKLPPPLPFVHTLKLAGAGVVSTSAEDRLRASVGASTRDTLRAGVGAGTLLACDCVVYPQNEAEVTAALRFASTHHLAIVPYGGGTAVSGGLEPSAEDVSAAALNGRVALHLGRMNRVIHVNDVDLTVTVQPGVLGPELEDALRPRGLSARFFPQSFAKSSVGGWVATRAGGHFATGPTHIDEIAQAVRVVTPAGVVATASLPASGAGPDICRLVCGSEGAFGVLTEIVLRVQRVPQSRAAATFDFPVPADADDSVASSFYNAAAAARAVVQAGLLPSNLRAVDEREAMVMGLGRGDGAVLLLAFESQLADSSVIDAQLAAAAELVKSAGGVLRRRVGGGSSGKGGGADAGAQQWKSSFVVAPAGRDDILLRGFLVETLETAVCWSRFKALHAAVARAICSAASKFDLMVVVTCRLTHVYTDGCAPYFTVACSERLAPEQMLSAWDAIKQEANEAISANGGTASHHHAVGRDHLSVYTREVGPLALDALSAVKAAWDPAGIMNPGALGLKPVGTPGKGGPLLSRL